MIWQHRVVGVFMLLATSVLQAIALPGSIALPYSKGVRAIAHRHSIDTKTQCPSRFHRNTQSASTNTHSPHTRGDRPEFETEAQTSGLDPRPHDQVDQERNKESDHDESKPLSPHTSTSAHRSPEKRFIWIPHVLYPNAGTVWLVGSSHNVTWSTRDAPFGAESDSWRGIVLLRRGREGGRIVASGPGSIDEPLAKDFSLLDGRTEVVVPEVDPGPDYCLVLFGDSGNFSPFFSIVPRGSVIAKQADGTHGH